MIPGFYPLALLALAAFRLTRLLAWDTWPPIVRVRSCLLGGVHVDGDGDEALVFYGRPLLGDLFECAFCLGWWVGLAFYAAWIVAPTATLVLAVPLAISAVVGLVAKNLDA